VTSRAIVGEGSSGCGGPGRPAGRSGLLITRNRTAYFAEKRGLLARVVKMKPPPTLVPPPPTLVPHGVRSQSYSIAKLSRTRLEQLASAQ
jgi:hypothetical protein